MSKYNKLYDEITAKIIEKLKVGVLPWRKSWKYGLPQNFITKKTYQGINYLNLCFEDFPSQYYLTYLQCKSKEGSVLKGAKSKSIIYWKISEIEEGNSIRRVPFLRLSNVFNLSQTTLYEKEVGAATPSLSPQQIIINNMNNIPTIKNNFNRCYYDSMDDYISIPPINDFENHEEYYSALFHEIAHSTGHYSRLNRFADNISSSEEELIAELTSSYLCAVSGISSSTLNNQAAYLQSWITNLHGDNTFIARVSNQAKKACDWILSYQHDQENQSTAV